ncbi:MAG: plasmid pRiA4b ORF-3 family protein [Eubacteriales bacterium]|nr:plasmid pRiA4b ORF-3 family protein [Eubacteriales bacterium]
MKRQKRTQKKISTSFYQEHAEVICRDFDTFCNYILENKTKISQKTGHIGKKDCFELNRLLHRKEPYEKATRFQEYYPVINLFHYIALKYEILELDPSGRQMLPGSNYQIYREACVEEKYVFFLVNCLFGKRGVSDNFMAKGNIDYFFQWKEREKPAVGITYHVSGRDLFGYFLDKPEIMACLEELMLIQVLVPGYWDGTKETLWEIRALPNLQPVTELYETICFEEEMIWTEDKKVGNYFEAYLKQVMPKQSCSPLMKFFLPTVREIEEKTIDFKVSLRYHDCWRILRLDFSDSLYDLHRMIQLAFDFDDDHLFNFTIGSGALKKTYTIMEGMTSGEELSVDDTCLGELGLREKQKFTYLFDYGDMWWFDIQVLKIMDGSIEHPAVIEMHNKAPEQYYYEDEPYMYACIDKEMEVGTILASIPDDLIEDEYKALLGYRETHPEKVSCKEKRREIERMVLYEPDRLLQFMTAEMREKLSELLKEASFEESDLCTIMKLYSFGFCMVQEDVEEILVPESVKNIYEPKLKRADRFNAVTDASEQILRRCGVIEMKELYSAVSRLFKKRMAYDEYVWLIFARFHYFGKYYLDDFDGKKVLSCYERYFTEKILKKRLEPENADYVYPEFDLEQTNASPKALQKWMEYVDFSLNIDWDTAKWLKDDFLLWVSSGIISKEEAVNMYKDTVLRAGSRMTKKASELITSLFEEMPSAARRGNAKASIKDKKFSECIHETSKTDDRKKAGKKDENMR